MATKTFYMGSGQDSTWGALFEAVQAAASRTDGWTVAKITSANASDFVANTKQASGTFTAASGHPPVLSASNAFKTPNRLQGKFAAGNWVFTFAVRATTASSQAGRMRMRVFKNQAASLTGATELTGATQVGTTSSALSTSADVTTVVTWTPGTTITLNGEFLFFVIAWEITTASGSNSGDVVMRTGSAATPTGSVLVTPDFAPSNIQFNNYLFPDCNVGNTGIMALTEKIR